MTAPRLLRYLAAVGVPTDRPLPPGDPTPADPPTPAALLYLSIAEAAFHADGLPYTAAAAGPVLSVTAGPVTVRLVTDSST